jgi:hypothetical protein
LGRRGFFAGLGLRRLGRGRRSGQQGAEQQAGKTKKNRTSRARERVRES